MAGNTQIDPKTEGGLFSLMHGITGMLVATVLLLTILAVLSIAAVSTQAANAENYYEVNQDLNALKFNSSDNHKMWINK
jgi:succinate dehydrogenase/fumarate reductase cytochrome b subunit